MSPLHTAACRGLCGGLSDSVHVACDPISCVQGLKCTVCILHITYLEDQARKVGVLSYAPQRAKASKSAPPWATPSPPVGPLCL